MPELQIELIVVGDEVLLGHTYDTNSHWIADALSARGLHLRWMSTVGDNVSDMRHQIRRAWNRSDVTLITGGLGPTHDDITSRVIARFFEDELILRPDLAKMIHDRFAARGLTPPPGSERMAEFPSRAEPLLNEHGSAPGIHYHQDGKRLIAMPGVPVEMRGIMEQQVLPLLISLRKGYFGFRIFRAAGIGESFLSQLIGDAGKLAPVQLAYLPSIDQGVTLRLSWGGADQAAVEAQLNQAADYVRGRIQEYIFTEDERSLEEVILAAMRAKGLTLTLA
ncbi:MAG: molybdopterin-binding protein, partial [Calditrichota bacterium]